MPSVKETRVLVVEKYFGETSSGLVYLFPMVPSFSICIRKQSLSIIYGIYRVGKNRSRATKLFFVICMGYEIYLALKRWVRNFFSFVDTSVARKLHFRHKMHVETYTHDVTCLQQSRYFGVCFV